MEYTKIEWEKLDETRYCLEQIISEVKRYNAAVKEIGSNYGREQEKITAFKNIAEILKIRLEG